MKVDIDIIIKTSCVTCDNVCWDLQNWWYCFIGNTIMCLMSHWQITFSIRVSLLILTTSLGEIKRKMFKLPMNICKQIYKLRKNISIYNLQMNVIKLIHTEGQTWVVYSIITRLNIMHPELEFPVLFVFFTTVVLFISYLIR